MYADKTLLVSLTTRAWGATRRDRAAANELTAAKGAQRGAAKVDKLLVPEYAIKPVREAIASARRTHDFLTTPWEDRGSRLLLARALDKYSEEMAVKINAVNAAADEFTRIYPTLRLAGQKHMGDMFDPSDYPADHDIRNRFGVTVDYMPVPTAGDLRVELAAEVEAEIKANIERTTAARFEGAVQSVRDRIVDEVGKLLTRIEAYGQDEDGKATGRFHASLVDNVARLADVIPMLNITGDAAIDKIAEDIRRHLVIDVERLKGSPDARKRVAGEAKKIINAAEDFFSMAA